MGFSFGGLIQGALPVATGYYRGQAGANQLRRQYANEDADRERRMRLDALQEMLLKGQVDNFAADNARQDLQQQIGAKGSAEGRAIQMAALNKPPTPQEAYQPMVGDEGPGVYGITEGQKPRRLGGVIEKPAASGGASGFRSIAQLRREFNGFVKPYEGLAQAFRKIHGAASDPSAAGDLSVVFGYMKLLDPASVVRESEQATAVNARGVPDAVRTLYNRVLNGERLAPAQREDFVRQARNLMSSQRAALSSQVNRYRGIAEANDIDPEQVIYDPFEGVMDEEVSADQPTPSGMTPAQAAFERWSKRNGAP